MDPFPLDSVLSTLFIMRFVSCHSSSLVQRLCFILCCTIFFLSPRRVFHSLNLMQSYSVVISFYCSFFYDEIVANNKKHTKEKRDKKYYPRVYVCADCIDISLESQTEKIECRSLRHSLHFVFDRLCVGRRFFPYLCRVCIMKNYYHTCLDVFVCCLSLSLALSGSNV